MVAVGRLAEGLRHAMAPTTEPARALAAATATKSVVVLTAEPAGALTTATEKGRPVGGWSATVVAALKVTLKGASAVAAEKGRSVEGWMSAAPVAVLAKASMAKALVAPEAALKGGCPLGLKQVHEKMTRGGRGQGCVEGSESR
jgi:hypothetical protein